MTPHSDPPQRIGSSHWCGRRIYCNPVRITVARKVGMFLIIGDRPAVRFAAPPIRGNCLSLISIRPAAGAAFVPITIGSWSIRINLSFPWHVNRNISPNERLTEEQKRRVGYFVLHQGAWWLVNERLSQCRDLTAQRDVPVGDRLALKDGQRFLLAREDGGRLALVQMAGTA